MHFLAFLEKNHSLSGLLEHASKQLRDGSSKEYEGICTVWSSRALYSTDALIFTKTVWYDVENSTSRKTNVSSGSRPVSKTLHSRLTVWCDIEKKRLDYRSWMGWY